MAIIAKRAEMLRVAKLVASASRSRTIPILTMMRVEMIGAALRLQCTDLDLQISGLVDVEGADFGIALLPAERLVRILRELPGETVSLAKIDDGRVEIASPDRMQVVRLVTAAEPDWPECFPCQPVTFKADIAEGMLQGLLAQVAFCISTEETRYYLNGVHFELRDDMLGLVATDGHRLSYREMGLPAASRTGELPRGVILPRDACRALLALPKGETELGFTSTIEGQPPLKGWLQSGRFRIEFKLIDGTFPDYRRVIPAATENVVEADAALLVRVLRMVGSASDSDARGPLSLIPGEGVIGVRKAETLSQFDKATKQNSVTIQDEAFARLAAKVTGKPPVIGVNGDLLIDSLKVFGAGRVRMSFADAGSPIRIESEGVSGLGVLMPMRIDANQTWKPEPIAA
jgi:DNA polymerase-3 subunit beta